MARIETLQTVRIKYSDVARDVARLCEGMDHRKQSEIIIRKGNTTAEFFVYTSEVS